MERDSPKRPTLGSLIPIATGLVALIGAVAYGIMRYSYQQFYDRFGLTPDDAGPGSAAALTQSGIRVATFVALFALLPAVLALAVSQGLAKLLQPGFARLRRSAPRITPIESGYPHHYVASSESGGGTVTRRQPSATLGVVAVRSET